jgi:threonine dehydrogenase-like Zn-dependent dehydrogenase
MSAVCVVGREYVDRDRPLRLSAVGDDVVVLEVQSIVVTDDRCEAEEPLIGDALAGEVIRRGNAVTDFEIGDRVVVAARAIAGVPETAPQPPFQVDWGPIYGQAREGPICTVPSGNAWRFDPAIAWEDACLAAFLAPAVRAVMRSRREPGSSALLLGEDAAILALAAVVPKAGFARVELVSNSVIVSDCAQVLGVHVLGPDLSWEDPTSRPDIVFVDSALSETVVRGIEAARPAGAIVTVGSSVPRVELDSNLLVMGDKRVRAACGFEESDHRYALRHLKVLFSSVAGLVTTRVALRDVHRSTDTPPMKSRVGITVLRGSMTERETL